MNESERTDAQLDEEGNEANTQLLELQDALINAMTASGLLGKIRAELRGAALGMLRGDESLQRVSVGEPFNLMRASPSTRLSLLIIQDFLHSKGLTHSSGVLEAEASTNLHSENDVAALQTAFMPLPGEGSILERLVTMVVDGDTTKLASHGAASQRTTLQTNNSPTPAQSVDLNSAAVPPEPTEEAPLQVQPVDEAVRDGVDQYEDSLPFEELDGPIETSRYEAVESV